MPEGATDFEKTNLFGKFSFVTGNEKWTQLDGTFAGQTQLSEAEAFQPDLVAWNHPLDMHFATTTLDGWPKFCIEVWHEDRYGRNELAGYGVTYVPTSPGEHELECVIWKPQGSLSERIFNYFFDTTSHLDHTDVAYTTGDRFDLITESVGSVHLRIEVLQRGFRNRGVEFKSPPGALA
ncbi:B9 domain-containing protein 2 [Hondaea fermentalgiana]|uniref:B9 domain-containing protein 2 n=1 Tax=Hondaea fermentalgiana TaxID=2315210 RepID=A0A2R5GEH3_9STRA|nr:B9 domain-containing protein 2 [Hondaea fermentalgiana]|eukprot:GBG28138.1 B9 domain-containing protein 2 [Hondaea fermentalgiana]